MSLGAGITIRFQLPSSSFSGYDDLCAVVVVVARPFDPTVTENTAMIIIGILATIVGIGFLCWLLFTLAVYALPFFVGVSAGMFAYNTGGGPIGPLAGGIAAGVLTLVIGQFAFACVRSTWVRIVIAFLFAAPAVLAGFHATHGLVKLTMPSEAWQTAFSLVAAAIVGLTTCARLATPSSSDVIAKG